MKAVVVSEFGGPEVLRLVDVPEPHAGPGQIRIRVHAATVNPADIVVRMGLAESLFADNVARPYRLGSEAAGVVDEIGPGTDTDLKIGDHAMAILVAFMPPGGAYAEYLVLDPRQVVRAPAGSSHAEAATLPVNGMTAQQGLDLLSLGSGDWLAVTGAAGAVGGYAVQLAKAIGLRVVADAAPDDADLLRSLGVDCVIARGTGVAERIRGAVPGGVSGVFDAALIGAEVLPAIRTGGQLVVARRSDLHGAPSLGDTRDITVHEVFVPEYLYERDKLDALRVFAEKGQLSLRPRCVTVGGEEADLVCPGRVWVLGLEGPHGAGLVHRPKWAEPG
ncbi:zinc-binding dehydrogenase [Streptomyces sp. NPDC048275]|uniref:alcohol dehydrogenase catalytic domain-containing protein n=1 Tax=Streptomyces sp. NPDC048275 TaxID=3155629 RepID=UPI0033FAEA62